MIKIDGITNFTGQWAILPARVRYDKQLPANAKLIYAEIAAKINEEGFCFCHNAYFSERLGIKRDTVSTLIKRLEDAEYIRIDVDVSRVNSDRRRIYLTSKPYEWGVSDLNRVASSSVMLRTIQGILTNPASLLARWRRCPAMISYPPPSRGRTSAG